MWIADFTDYKAFINAYIASQPKKGRGLARGLAEHLSVHPSAVTLILKHDAHLSLEQAMKAAAFFGFNDQTTAYFIELVSLGRADSRELREFFQAKIRDLQLKAMKPNVAEQKEISAADRGIFYSNWYYSAIRILTGHPDFRSVDAIAAHLKLPKKKVATVLEFLVRTGLCVLEEGQFRLGPKVTALGDSSEYLNNHRRNWRDRAREKFHLNEPTDYMMSFPMVLSEKDAERFQKAIRDLVEAFAKDLPNSPEETFRCLNIDYFKF